MFGAGNEVRTRDLNLGKVALYQLSYSRGEGRDCSRLRPPVKLNQGPFSPSTGSSAMMNGQAARRYTTIDQMVIIAARTRSTKPIV